jgi:osmotically-inducible protein OsmY
MKWIIGTLVLLFAITMVAQQDMQSNGLPAMWSNSDARHEIQSTFTTAPEFNNTEISAQVTDESVILTGYANSQEQKQEALRVASQYAGERQVVDQIELGGSPGRSE